MLTKEEILFLKSLTGSVHEDVSGYDLKKIFKIAAYHSILPLCYENISKAPGFDAENYKSLQTKIFSVVFSQAKRTENFKKIYQAFLDAGLKPVVIKGIICRQLYGEFCDHRPSGDEDILVKKEDFFRVQDILISYGYMPESVITEKMLTGSQEITFKNKNGLNIEVHLNIIGTENSFRRKMNKYFDNVFEKTITVEVDGQKYYTLDYTEHYIYLFYHMFKHFSTTGVGIRQVVDMFKFGEAYYSKIDWNTVHDAIKQINAHRFYGDIIEIGNKYLGFSVENKFGAFLTERLLDDIFSSGAYGNATAEQAGSKVKVMASLDQGGKAGKLKMLFPSIESLREYYKILYDHPYLLPFIWIVRIVRYVFRFKTGKTYDVLKSEKIADAKIELLKDYHIIR